jgi:hypothetical protein
MLGLQAIRFESRPRFGKKYWLRAKDEIATRALFNDAFINRLAAADPRATWFVEKIGDWLLVYQHNKAFAPAAVPSFLEATRRVADVFLMPR